MAMYGQADTDVYDPELGGHAKSSDGGYLELMEQSVRQGFIRKVFSILTVQLLTTLAVAMSFTAIDGVKAYVQANSWPLYFAFALTFGSLITLTCCGEMHRKFPNNYILLGVFTLAESYLVGTVTCQYDTETVLIAVGITATITLGLTLYALQTKRDFTTMGGMLFSALIAMVMFGFLAVFLPASRTLEVLYSSFGAFLFSCYIVYDVQLLMSGKKQITLSPDDYVFAALNLYLDVINLFLYILSLLGDRS